METDRSWLTGAEASQETILSVKKTGDWAPGASLGSSACTTQAMGRERRGRMMPGPGGGVGQEQAVH